MSVWIERILGLFLGLAIALSGCLYIYSEQQHATVLSDAIKLDKAASDVAQAQADRAVAEKAASDAATNLLAQQRAAATAQASAVAALADMKAARARLSQAAATDSVASAVLRTEVPDSVWNAIYQDQTGGK